MAEQPELIEEKIKKHVSELWIDCLDEKGNTMCTNCDGCGAVALRNLQDFFNADTTAARKAQSEFNKMTQIVQMDQAYDWILQTLNNYDYDHFYKFQMVATVVCSCVSAANQTGGLTQEQVDQTKHVLQTINDRTTNYQLVIVCNMPRLRADCAQLTFLVLLFADITKCSMSSKENVRSRR